VRGAAAILLLASLGGCGRKAVGTAVPAGSSSAAPVLLTPPRAAGSLLVAPCERLDARGSALPPGGKLPASVAAAHRVSQILLKGSAAGAPGGQPRGEASFAYCALPQDVLPAAELFAAEAVFHEDGHGETSYPSMVSVAGGQARAVLVAYEPGGSRKPDGRWRRVAACPVPLGPQGIDAPACADLTADFQRRAAGLLASPVPDRAALESFALLLAAVSASAPMARTLSPEEMDDRDSDADEVQVLRGLPPPLVTTKSVRLYAETASGPFADRSLYVVRLEAAQEETHLKTERLGTLAPPFAFAEGSKAGHERTPDLGLPPVSLRTHVRVVAGAPASEVELRRSVAHSLPALKRCYQESLRDHPGLAGSIELAARIDAAGQPGAATAKPTGTLAPSVARCAERSLQESPFAPPRVAPLEFKVTLRLRTFARWPDFPL
jgi:hypothetical protein